MVPGYDCAASVLLCAEDNAAILGLDDDGEESSWAAAATPPRDTVAAAAATGVAVDGILTEFPLLLSFPFPRKQKMSTRPLRRKK